MEKVVAVKMFGRSFILHNLKYTTYVGDGDSSSFGDVCETMKKHGNRYLVLQVDCVGYIWKRMGSNLIIRGGSRTTATPS